MAFRSLIVKGLGIRTARMEETKSEEEKDAEFKAKEEEYKLKKINDKRLRYSGVPNIPSDIGFNSSKTISGKGQQGGTMSQVISNPFVILGMALTTYALMGMIKRSFTGDRLGTQKYMQYRIMAQFFTVTAMVGGVAYYGATYEQTNKKI